MDRLQVLHNVYSKGAVPERRSSTPSGLTPGEPVGRTLLTPTTPFADPHDPQRLSALQTGLGTVSARVPDDLEAELESYVEEEHLDRSTAVRKLLPEGLDEWRRERALGLLADARVSFSRAAEIAELSVWDVAPLAREHDVTWVSADHLDADLEDR